ncbi:hypothetical protein B0O99DRAFT_111490 [Bisporella sp. PMI_857]|nr:hypothetical protein B0O99DRAFT_111490 [Bisporella sp. PMI_857]
MATRKNDAEIRWITSLSDKEATHLADIVNTVYSIGEGRFWVPGWTRTTPAALSSVASQHELIGAYVSSRLVGCLRSSPEDDAGTLSILAVSTEAGGKGIATDMIVFAEEHWKAQGKKMMKLEILVPRDRRSETKERLRVWYGRMGYVKVRTGTLDEGYGDLVKQLAIGCDLIFHEKVL